MDSVRYFFAFMLLITLPPAFMFWVIIHPLIHFWRRLGPGWTYALLSVPMILMMAGLYRIRGRLLAVDFGTRVPVMVLALLSILAGGVIAWKRRRFLTAGILAGLPELSMKRCPGKLLTEGIYSRVRHPRYVEIFFLVLGYALFSNNLGGYGLVVFLIPTIYFVVWLEERELRDRFGNAYEAYCREVPRFFPRRK